MDLPDVGPYRILRRLGAGGMGEVFLAEDTRLGRKVALKKLFVAGSSEPELRRRLLREARAAATISHPNIAVVYDVLDTLAEPVIVMEFVDGESLAARLRRSGRLPLPDAVRIAAELADGLATAHRAGIVHRDLKPGNVVCTGAGRAKILDFGLARTPLAGESRASSSGHVVGTPRYMAPEQMLGYRADARSDLYSLGVLLFELLAGRGPFDRRGEETLDVAGMEEQVRRAVDEEPVLAAELRPLLGRLLRWEPSERPGSADEVAAELRGIAETLTEQPTLVRPSAARSAPSRAKRGPLGRLRRRRGLLAAAAALVVAGAVFVGLRSRPGSDAPAGPGPPVPVVAVLPLANLTGDPAMDPVGLGIAHSLVTKLSALPSVTTVSRAASRAYADETDARRVARELGASFLVRGTLQRAGGRLRVLLSLVRADEAVVWGGEYEAGETEIFELQRRLARAVAAALRLRLSPAEADVFDAPPSADRNAYAEFTQGRAYLERRATPEDLVHALRLLESAVERDPGFVLAHASLAEAYWARYEDTNDPRWADEARRAADRALELDPDEPAARVALAAVDRGMGRTNEAVRELRSVLAVQPRNDDARARLGTLLAEMGRVDEAVEELRTAIEIRPGFHGHHRALGLVFYNAGRWEEAAAAFRRVTELRPDMASAFQALGAAYHQMGRLDEALANYRASIERGPSAASYSNMGTVLYRQGRLREAVDAYERAIELSPASPATHRNLGDTYRRLGERARAERAYGRAVELVEARLGVNPRDARRLGLLAVVEAKLGRFADADRHAREALRLAPDDAQVRYRRAVVHALAGEPEDAVEALDEALRRGYSVSEVRHDDDLAPLRDRADYERLVGPR